MLLDIIFYSISGNIFELTVWVSKSSEWSGPVYYISSDEIRITVQMKVYLIRLHLWLYMTFYIKTQCEYNWL